MKIGIDCRTILNPAKGQSAGLGHYVYQLVRHLISNDKQNTYVLFFDRSIPKKRLKKFIKKNTIIKLFPFISYTKFLKFRYFDFLESAVLLNENLDIFHSPLPSLPLSYKGNSVVTVHDVSIYRFPELYSKKEVFNLKKEIPDTLKRANKIITASNSTKKDLIKIFNINPEKIKVVYHGIDKRFFKKSSDSSIRKIKIKYKIKKKYFLFLGTLDKRKNITGIIDAYEHFRDKKIDLNKKIKHSSKFFDYQLVLAGAVGENSKDISRKISFSKYKKDILLPGYIEADELCPLFQGAEIFISPSIYEGFGTPIIEAMANNLPVISSNVSSIPEITDNCSILVNPNNSKKIAQTMYDLLSNKELRQAIISCNKQRAKFFDWDKCAKETIDVYKKI